MLSLPRGRLALGIGVAVGVAAVASTLLFYSFSVRRRRAKQESTTRFATVPEKVNADGKEKPKLLVIKKSKTAADKKKKGSSRKKKGSSRKTKKDSKRDRESIRSPSIHVPTNLISCDCRTDKNMEITPADSEGFDIGTDEFNVDLLLPQCTPICYEKYKPINWLDISDEDKKENVDLAVLKDRYPVKTDILTPFRPTLNALAYAHKHSRMLTELRDSYQYIET